MKRNPKQYYLPSLYRKSPMMFWLVCLFFILHINANFFFGGQQTPFFYWSLYSVPVAPQDEYLALEVRYNLDKIIHFPHTWRQPQRLLYHNTLNQYYSMMKYKKDPLKDYIDNWNTNYPAFANMFPKLKFYNDSIEVQQFPDWYVKKVEQLTHERVFALEIYEVWLKYTAGGHVEKISDSLLYKLK